ncbi:MAG: hypothetical protein IPJ38_19750 [Dechloromonas sp.]|uniref:Uncharacterized protein n=1 Tax=Candidatus Dechloromonas phosphorivorans TaxID=2899244 RepID=A0A935K5H3_9RHOO|nr:hypothetical protein [Candidatus Dechloromonas phosphorivorans]
MHVAATARVSPCLIWPPFPTSWSFATASGTEFTQAVAWDAQASAVNSWKVPESAKLGTYEIALSGGKRGETSSGETVCGRFSPARLYRQRSGCTGAPGGPTSVPLALGLSFLNGGAAKMPKCRFLPRCARAGRFTKITRLTASRSILMKKHRPPSRSRAAARKKR